ncbi:hypothetical protein [Flavobacterium sp.]|uniref:hypothetical protein n=1 Tax=Flavobacterium sp. TaxID=239 RepID=UPI0035291D08
MAHPEMELLDDHKASLRSAMNPFIRVLKKLAKNINNKVINKMMQQLFVETQALFTETLPQSIIQELQLVPKTLHYSIFIRANQELLAKAQFRLKFEELFLYNYN